MRQPTKLYRVNREMDSVMADIRKLKAKAAKALGNPCPPHQTDGELIEQALVQLRWDYEDGTLKS